MYIKFDSTPLKNDILGAITIQVAFLYAHIYFVAKSIFDLIIDTRATRYVARDRAGFIDYRKILIRSGFVPTSLAQRVHTTSP